MFCPCGLFKITKCSSIAVVKYVSRNAPNFKNVQCKVFVPIRFLCHMMITGFDGRFFLARISTGQLTNRMNRSTLDIFKPLLFYFNDKSYIFPYLQVKAPFDVDVLNLMFCVDKGDRLAYCLFNAAFSSHRKLTLVHFK